MKIEKIEKLQIFSLRLKALRKEKRAKQAEMAELLGVTSSHYQKIEYGHVNISATSLMLLADYFGVTTDYLLGRSEAGGPAGERRGRDDG